MTGETNTRKKENRRKGANRKRSEVKTSLSDGQEVHPPEKVISSEETEGKNSREQSCDNEVKTKKEEESVNINEKKEESPVDEVQDVSKDDKKERTCDQEEQPLYLDGLSDFSKLIEVLRTKFLPSDKYASCQDNESKIRCCLTQDEVVLGFEKYSSNGFFVSRSQESRKSDARAKHFRNEGNKYFKGKKFHEALESYSRAVLSAPFTSQDHQDAKKQSLTQSSVSPSKSMLQDDDDESKGTREVALCFANRSSTLFHLNHFEDSLRDCQTALRYDYPSEQRHTLLLRQALCFKALGREKEARETLKKTIEAVEVSGNLDAEGETSEPKTIKAFIETTFEKFSASPAVDLNKPEGTSGDEHLTPINGHNKYLRNASEWISLKVDAEKGRCLKTTREVGVDETVLSETAFATCLNTQSMESFCHHCCQSLGNHLVPCYSCSSVKYCSNSCRDSSWQSYHRHECLHLDLLLSMGVLRLALRILLVAGVTTCTRVDDTTKCSAPQDNVEVNSSYGSIYSLSDHSQELSPLVSARQTLAAAFMLFVLSEKVMGVINSKDEKYFQVGSLILKHIHQISINSILIYHQPLVSGPHDIYGVDIKSQAIATAIFPTLSLMNHSCIPNTENFFRGSTVFVKTRQPLSPNQELTLTYGPLFKKMTRNERMDTLQNQYHFKCKCPACFDDVLSTSSLTDHENYPVLSECFLCPVCPPNNSSNGFSSASSSTIFSGPLVINSNQEAKCLKCGVKTLDVLPIIEKIESAKKVCNLCKALSSFGRKTEAEKHLLKTLTSLSSVSYPGNRLLLSVYSELISLFLSLDRLEECKKYCEDMNNTRKLSFGIDSFEHRQGLLQLLNIRWMQQKKFDENKSTSSSIRTSSMNKKIIQRLIQESNEAVSSGMKLLEQNKLKTGIVLLDSALVSFLKELVQLERNVKAAQ